MATIVRCPNCISLVYEGAKVCHHCGEHLSPTRRRFLTKRTILFIIAAVMTFGVGDAIYLAKERGRTLRYDRRAVERFVMKAVNHQLPATLRADERPMIESLRAHLAQEAGCTADKLHEHEFSVGELSWRHTGREVIVINGSRRDMDVRHHTVSVSFWERRTFSWGTNSSPQSTLISFGVADTRHGRQVVMLSPNEVRPRRSDRR